MQMLSICFTFNEPYHDMMCLISTRSCSALVMLCSPKLELHGLTTNLPPTVLPQCQSRSSSSSSNSINLYHHQYEQPHDKTETKARQINRILEKMQFWQRRNYTGQQLLRLKTCRHRHHHLIDILSILFFHEGRPDQNNEIFHEKICSEEPKMLNKLVFFFKF